MDNHKGNLRWANICFRSECFSVQMAETMFQKMRGLKFVDDLRRNEGMIFMFRSERRRAFWMKDVFVPLDLIWLDEKFRVVEITSDQKPCQGLFCPIIISKNKAQHVVELNGGTADRIGIRDGELAEVPIQ